jgi:hypothetical protein
VKAHPSIWVRFREIDVWKNPGIYFRQAKFAGSFSVSPISPKQIPVAGMGPALKGWPISVCSLHYLRNIMLNYAIN